MVDRRDLADTVDIRQEDLAEVLGKFVVVVEVEEGRSKEPPWPRLYLAFAAG